MSVEIGAFFQPKIKLKQFIQRALNTFGLRLLMNTYINKCLYMSCIFELK